MKITDKIVEQIYAGWLGKAVGIRYGAPVEMWSAEQIAEKFAGKEGYFVDYRDFAADDDSNGPIFFYKGFADCPDSKNVTSAEIGEGWLNYAPYLHGFYWWGGYGVSTEHTAYLNMTRGILPPRSGSMLQNGKLMAEQIGGQIFSDVWGLIYPGEYVAAADLAEKASRVSHDGNGVYGGRFVAACISAAFTAKSVGEILRAALSTIPEESDYAKMTKELLRIYREGGTQAECFAYIRKRYWKEDFGGNCHIIPNAAIMVMAMLYGEGNFEKTLKIANYSGFDTDCNVGNLGAIFGVFCGLDSIGEKWLRPVNDTTLCSSVLGASNIVDIPTFAKRLAAKAVELSGEKYEGRYELNAKDMDFDFAFPQSTHGFRSKTGILENVGGGLRLCDGGPSETFIKTYYGKEDLHDNRYDPCFSPVAVPGNTLYAEVECGKGNARLFYRDRHTGKVVCSESGSGKLSLKIDADREALVDRVGILSDGETILRRFKITGNADYRVNFSREYVEDYSLEHKEVSQCTYFKGLWTLEEGCLFGRCCDEGELYTSLPMRDYTLQTRMTLCLGDCAGVLVRVQGAARSYGVVFTQGEMRLVKKSRGKRELLASAVCPYRAGEAFEVRVRAQGDRRSAEACGAALEYTDKGGYSQGCIGALVLNGSVLKIEYFDVKETGGI